MVVTERKDRSIREQRYRSQSINSGINSNNSAWIISEDEMSDGSNVIFNRTAGFRSERGKRLLNLSNFVFGAYLTNKGGEYFQDKIVCAQSNGSETKIFWVDPFNATVNTIGGASNSFNGSNVMAFAVAEDFLYMVDGQNVLRRWDGVGNVLDVIPTAGVIPTAADIVFFWRDRIWVANTNNSVNEIKGSAIFDHTHWDTAFGNGNGDKAFSWLVDDNEDDPILQLDDGLTTMVVFKRRSIHFLVGTNEADWRTVKSPIDEGLLAPLSTNRGTDSVFYLSTTGIKFIRGTQTSDFESKYDTVKSITVSDGIRQFILNHSNSERQAAAGIVFNDRYIVRIGTDTVKYDLVANNGNGAIEIDKKVLSNISTFITSSDDLFFYGISQNDGFVYTLESGEFDYRFKFLESFEDSLDWTATNCVASNDSTSGHFIEGAQGVRMAVTNQLNATIEKAVAYDLTTFDGINPSTLSDEIGINIFLNDKTKLDPNETIKLFLETTPGVDYFVYQFSYAALQIGSQEIFTAKNLFTAVGAADFANITNVKLEGSSTVGQLVNITFDLLRMRDIGAYVKEAFTKSFDFDYPDHIKNYNEIRVWGKTQGTYPVKVDYFIDDSLTAAGTFTVQLLGQSGGFYLDEHVLPDSSTLSSITKLGAGWTTNEWIGHLLYDYQSNQIFLIVSNTTDTLFFV